MRSRVELFENIRKDWRLGEPSIRKLADRHKVHRRTVRQALADAVPPPRKAYPVRPRPAIDEYVAVIDAVRGHEKVPTGGQVEVSVFGQVKVSTPCSSCRSGTAGPDGDGEGANQSPSPPGSSIEVCEGPHGHHFCLPTVRVV